MKFSVRTGKPEKQRCDCLVVGIHDKRQLTPTAKLLDQVCDGVLSSILDKGDMDGGTGQSLLLHDLPGIRSARVLLIGCGKQDDLTDLRFREVCAKGARILDDSGSRDATSYLTELEVPDRDLPWKIRQLVEASSAACYRFDELKSEAKSPATPLRKLEIGIPGRRQSANAEPALAAGTAIADGVALARTLGNLPGNICTPGYLAEQAQALGKQHRPLKVSVLREAAMKKQGMGALLSVSSGSAEEARLIVMEYRNGAPGDKPVVLVGKGITFDSGGISIKGSAAMDEMKYDMCGGASVLGAVKACALLQLPINLVGIVPASENLPDGRASKPGDIVTSLAGKTVEILNTDAEGRLVLCDALSYAERFDPAVVIDIATLTGACIVALGKHPHGLFCNDQRLAADLLAAGERAVDRAWQLPLWDDYQDQLKSNFADMANIGGREGGAITAACFLSRFTEQYRWAHLDIAGTAWLSGAEKGATGRPVGLLVQYLLDHCATAGA